MITYRRRHHTQRAGFLVRHPSSLVSLHAVHAVHADAHHRGTMHV